MNSAKVIDAGWLTEAFQAAPENTSEATAGGSVQKAKIVGEKSAVENESSATSTATSKKGVVGGQSSLTKSLDPVCEIRKMVGK